MNTRNAYSIRASRATPRPVRRSARQSLAQKHSVDATAAGAAPQPGTHTPTSPSFPEGAFCIRHAPALSEGRHPLADLQSNARLARCEESITHRFDAILPTLQTIALLPRDERFAPEAQRLSREKLGYELPERTLQTAWISGLDLGKLYAFCVFQSLRDSVAQFSADLQQQKESVQDTRNFFLDCGFHAVDISPCADGRLKGLLRYILRMPLTSFSRRTPYAGALFDIETSVQHWIVTELRRHREGVPTPADSGTRYLKMAVYHYSSTQPSHQGCAAFGSRDLHAVEAVLTRLNQFREAIENAFCCGASADLLLLGVDTDTDAIRIHVPDADGVLSAHRYVDNSSLYSHTVDLSIDQACLAVYEAIRTAGADTPWGRASGPPHEGMRRLIANFLIHNLSQIDYVIEHHGGLYADIGHAERYISVGDGFEELQLRNIAFSTHLKTLEEGAPDLDIGIALFERLNVQRGLPIPVAIHFRYDARVPGARDRMVQRARRIQVAIQTRYPVLANAGHLCFQVSVQDLPAGSALEIVQEMIP